MCKSYLGRDTEKYSLTLRCIYTHHLEILSFFVVNTVVELLSALYTQSYGLYLNLHSNQIFGIIYSHVQLVRDQKIAPV